MQRECTKKTESADLFCAWSLTVAGCIWQALPSWKYRMEATDTEIVTQTSLTFSQLHPKLQDALNKVGYSAFFPVQEQAFSPILHGEDVVVQSRTGSGKTAAFAIPLVQKWLLQESPPVPHRPAVLVLVPTRELALQVTREFHRLTQDIGLRVAAIYGGSPMGKQTEELQQGVHIVVGTPGRVLDHLKRENLVVDDLRTLVLDEADEMLSRGFLEEVTQIIEKMPSSKQQILLSATLPSEIERLCERSMKNPVWIRLSTDVVSPSEISHSYYLVSGVGRVRDLLRVLDIEKPTQAIIFCNTREETEEVALFLRNQGLHAQAISSNLTQREREVVMAKVKAHTLPYLVATDIAARGIDVSQLSHVINFTFPESPEVYIHRTGRTGRAGETGKAISLIGPHELGSFYTFKLTYPIRPQEQEFPSAEELQRLREEKYVEQLQAELVRHPPEVFLSLTKRLMATPEGQRILAVALERHLTSSTVGSAVGPEDSVETQQSSAEPLHSDEQASFQGMEREKPARRRTERAGAEKEKGTRPTRHKRSKRDSEEKQEFSAKRSGKRTSRVPQPEGNASLAEVTVVSEEPIELSEGREYWEAWVDSKNTVQPSSQQQTMKEHNTEPEIVKDSAESSDFAAHSWSGSKVYLNVGRRHGINKQKLERLLQEHGMPNYPCSIRFAYTHLLVPEAEIESIIAALHGKTYKRRSLVCERARVESIPAGEVGDAVQEEAALISSEEPPTEIL